MRIGIGLLLLAMPLSCSAILGFDDVEFIKGGSGAGSPFDAGDPGSCAEITCGENQHCSPLAGACVCNAGYQASSSGCELSPSGALASRTFDEVCGKWKAAHEYSDPEPWKPGASECDTGTLSEGGRADALARLSAYRWLVGLGPVDDNGSLNEASMYCAVMTSWNQGGGYNPHAPTNTAKCYSAQGADMAAKSVILWGPHVPAEAMDWLVQDYGNDSTLGNRRWVLDPPLGPIGIGFYAGGGPQGTGFCMPVFEASGYGPRPEWFSFPPPGHSPVEMTEWTWSFHHVMDVSMVTMKIERLSDGSSMPVSKVKTAQGYGSYYAASFKLNGWAPSPGETYTVAIVGVPGGNVEYQVKPINCQ